MAAGLTGRQLRVLLAVFSFTTSWSKLTDHVALDQLGPVAGFTTDDEDRLTDSARRHLRRDLQALASSDVVVYEPGGGRGRGSPSLIGVREPAEQLSITYPQADQEGGLRRAPHTEEGGPNSDRKGGSGETERGAQEGPPPEKYPEKVPEDARARAEGAPAAHAVAARAEIRRKLGWTARHTHEMENTG